METLVDKLNKSAQSLVCFGMDPTLEGFPVPPVESKGCMKLQYEIRDFFGGILREMRERKVVVGAFKPNEGFYLKFDKENIFAGTRALGEVLILTKNFFSGVPTILDIKRGDIGKSSENYAQHAGSLDVDGVTVHPYMGTDSVEPFLRLGGTYVLCRTSNKGREDMQDVKLEDGRPLYMHTASLIAGKWYDVSPGNVGAVVGATGLDELECIASYFKTSGRDIPLLIPGVGKQGGSAKEVVGRLRNVGYDLGIVRINSSSGISEAWKKEGYSPADYAKAAVDEIQRLNEEVGYSQI